MEKALCSKAHRRFMRIVVTSGIALCVMSQPSTAQPASWAVDGTTGAPLGGIGTGAVKFCSHQGSFYGALGSPCALPNFTSLTNMQFQFFSDRSGTVQTSQKLSAVITSGRADDDAIYPVQYANFGSTNGVSMRLTAFAPYDPANPARMCYPLALYELKVINTQATAVAVAGALQFQTGTNPTVVSGKGLRTAIDRALYASSDKTGVTISAGSDNGFFTSGVCSNAITGAINRVAVKVSLNASDSASIRFVFAWFSTDTARYWYYNAGSNAAAFADSGLAFFPVFETKATELVTRMRASNFPGWLINQTQNSMCNLTNSSIYTKDGRYCHTEGEWNMNGTMDQMWHARHMNTMFVPRVVWQELEYWARTQKTNPVGQIHHDMAQTMANLVAWDDQQHADYRTIDTWVDLNCGFIISVYEAFIATDDLTRLNQMWPYVKKAAQRILTQTVQYAAAGYPYTFQGSQNSYDAGGSPDPYNASLSAAAYKVMTKLAAIQNESALIPTYQNAFDTVCLSFTQRYLSNNFPTGRISESVLVGQWLGFFLKFGDFFPKAAFDYGLVMEDSYYQPLKRGFFSDTKTYNEWGPYLVSHLGGLYLQTGNLSRWRALQYDYAERTFLDRNLVFNTYLDIPPKVTTPTYLATDASGYNQYISMPVLWRNYYTIVGFQRNKHSNEVWLEPIVLQELNHVMTDALIVTPEGYATVSCTESGQKFQNRTIRIASDNPMTVSSVYLRDSYGQNVSVTVDGVPQTFTRIGTGYSKELKVDWNGSIGSSGTTIVTSGDTTASDTLAFISSPRDPFKRVEAEMYTSASSGIQTEPCSDAGGTSDVGYTTNNSYIAFDSLNFQNGAIACTLRVAAASTAGGTVELRLDSANGTIIGTATISNTGGWQNWVTIACPVSGVSGIHTLYIVFRTTNQYTGNVNWLVFKRVQVNVVFDGNIMATVSPAVYRLGGKAQIVFNGAGKHIVDIIGINGRKIRSFTGAGRQRYELSAKSSDHRLRLPVGTYILSINQGGWMRSELITIFK